MAETPAQHATCLETATYGDLPNRTYVCGPDCPRPAGPDPARDARVDAYRDRERRRAARALDRYVETLQSGDVAVSAVAGERLVELVGDYVLARLSDRPAEFCGNRVDHKRHTWSDYGVPKDCDGVSDLQQKSHYGATEHAPGSHFGGCPDRDWTGEPYLSCEAPHNAECGCKVGCTTVCYCDGAGRHVHGGNCPPLAVSEDEAQRSDIRISGRP